MSTAQIGTADALLHAGTAAGVDAFVLLPVAVNPVGVRHVNAYVVERVAAQPDRFFGFGTVHPDMEDMMGELEYIVSSGLIGVKLHPDMQAVDTDSPRLYPLCEQLVERGLPLYIHCGDEHRDHSHPRRLRRLLDRFPDLTVIAAHLGGWSHWDDALELLKDTSCYVDTSSSQMFMQPERFLHYIRAFGAHRVLFGTDFPIWHPEEEVRAINALPLTAEEKELIFYRNAERLLEE